MQLNSLFSLLQLILNVDGCIAVCFVDLLRDSGAFTPDEADEYIKVCVPRLFRYFQKLTSLLDRYAQRPVRARSFDWLHRSPLGPEASACAAVPPSGGRYLHQHGGRVAAACSEQDGIEGRYYKGWDILTPQYSVACNLCHVLLEPVYLTNRNALTMVHTLQHQPCVFVRSRMVPEA